jgi:hypothetical protein
VRQHWHHRLRLRGRLRGLCHCRLLGAVVLLQEVPVQAFERAKGTNLELVLYDSTYDTAWQVMVLLETQNPPSSCDSWSRMSTQARSCWFHVL